MLKRHTLVLLAVTLIASLVTGTMVSGAQLPGSLTETFTWDAYDLAIRYPGDWVAVDNGTTISIRPIDRDVSDGFGPELVLFEAIDAQPNALDAAFTTLAANSGATPEEFISDQIAGRAALTASLNWAEPQAFGSMRLIAVDDQTVIGAGYVVRAADALAYTLPLVEMMQSIAFGADGAVQVGESSVSVASVRLTESVAWPDTGLILNFPEAWAIEFDTLEGDETIIAVPESARGSSRFHIIQATTVEGFSFFDLQELAEVTSEEVELTSGIVETTVAGYPAVTYEFRDTDEDEVLYLRTLMIDVADRDVIGLVVFATRESAWDEFRPIVGAVSGSIQAVAQGRSALDLAVSADTNAILVATTVDSSPALPPVSPLLRDSELTFTWEEAGATFTLPEGWATRNGDGQDFDVALLSPEVQQTGAGTFVKLRLIPMLGSSPDELGTAIQSIADQVGVEAKMPYGMAGLEGAGINYTDEETGYVFHFMLLPYGDHGDVLYIQTTADPEVDAAVIGILNSMMLDIPIPDYAAADAAWQASLAENGTLTIGDADAPVKLVEYLSFTCGHCVNYSRSMGRFIALDAETGRVQFSLAMLTGDEYATNATHATYCAAEQGKGFSAHEALFQGYNDIGYDVAYTRDGINDLLVEFDLDMDDLNACIDEQRYADQILQTAITFTDLGLTGTPTVTFGVDGADPTPVIFPDGQVWSGAIPLHWVRDIVEAYIEDGITPNEFVIQ